MCPSPVSWNVLLKAAACMAGGSPQKPGRPLISQVFDLQPFTQQQNADHGGRAPAGCWGSVGWGRTPWSGECSSVASDRHNPHIRKTGIRSPRSACSLTGGALTGKGMQHNPSVSPPQGEGQPQRAGSELGCRAAAGAEPARRPREQLPCRGLQGPGEAGADRPALSSIISHFLFITAAVRRG